MSRKLDEKQRRRQEQERRRAEQRRAVVRRNLTTVTVAVVVAALVVFLIVRERDKSDAPTGVAAAQAGCTDPEEFESEGRGHIEQGTEHEPYQTSPPTSGPHYSVPADPGFYDSPLIEEQLVHNMEHGQIVIWYSEDVSTSERAALEEIVDEEPASTVAVPWDGLEPNESVAVTAWTASMRCQEISEAAINEFRREYQGQAPEPLTPPFEG